ncbi:MAG TPA: tetratricopeptide repeat protein, partial [Chthoniobacteraceae bacterium]
MTSGGNLPIPKALTRARPLLAAPVAVLLFAATYVQAADPNLLRSANRALAEAIPQVAIEKLRTFLAAPDLTPEDRHKAEALLVEGMLSANLVDEALLATDSFTKSTSPRLRLLRAHALAATGRWSEALPIYRQLAAAPDAPLAPKLGEAECLHALGQTGRASELIEGLVRRGDAPVGVQLRHASLLVELRQEKRGWAALNAIQPITPEEKKWQHYVEGQLALLQDRPDAARLSFESVLRDESHLSENLHVGATLGIAEARMALQGSEAGEKVLETFIWAHPHSAYLELAFRRLDQIYAMQERASEDDLHGWVKKPEARRSALARFYVARLQIRKKKPDKAAQSLQAFVRDHPGHPLLPYVHLTQADLLLEKGDNPGALAALEAAARQVTTDELRADVELRTAFVHFRRSEYLLAANTFQRAAQRSPRLRESSLFNAALSTLNLKNFERFLTEFTELSQRYPESPLRSELMLEQGLLQARLKDPRAAETLQLFLHHFPRAPRVAEAHLALAELVFEGRSDGDGARYLRAANTLPSAPEIGAHADYLAIFAADRQTPRDDSTVVRLAEEFIQAHAG